jgi:hypothetical protein
MLRDFQQKGNSYGIRNLKSCSVCKNLRTFLFGPSIFVAIDCRSLTWTDGVTLKSKFTTSELGIEEEDCQY